MLSILIKIILCSSIFVAVYYLFLEKEKMYRFNRFYLLSSLILSYIIPFITITIQSAKVENKPLLMIEETQQVVLNQPEHMEFSWVIILWIIYLAITSFLLIKSILAFIAIKRIKGEKKIYNNYNVIITKNNISPFSFWNTIYIGKDYVKNGIIDPRIFLHEKSHLDQKHSIDLIIMHLMATFTWVNPILFLYKRAMTTNHEFLADEAVLSNKFDIKEYQKLILEEVLNSQNQPFTHSFNFNNTKKRFIMMKSTKTKLLFLRKTIGITALAAVTALLSEKIYANHSVKIESTPNHMNTNIDKEDLNKGTQQIFQSSQANLTTSSNSDKGQQESLSTTLEYKKESLNQVLDTISPRKISQTNTNEGKNTNATINEQADPDLLPAQYPEGNMGLRRKIGNIMDTSKVDPLNGTITATANVHIDDSGKMTDVTVSGTNDSFNKEYLKTITIIGNETTWKPAMKDGKAIASILKVPATMTFVRP